MRRIFTIVPCVFVLNLILILGVDRALAQTNVSGNQGNTVWTKANSPYLLTGDVTVPIGQTLTIEAGSKIEIPVNTVFSINGTLIANGSATDSIRFLGKGGVYGGEINFSSSSSNSIMSYISLDSLGQVYCPYYCYDRPAILAAGPLVISNSSIRNSGHFGIQVERSSVSVNNCSFYSNNTSYSSINIVSDTISPVIHNCVFNGTDKAKTVSTSPGSISNLYENTNAIIELNGNVTKNSSWQKPGVNSYYRANNVTVNTGQTLTIQAGSRIEIPVSTVFSINGTLIANGSVSDSIRFFGKRSANYTYGGGINFASGSSNSIMSYVSVDSLGQVYCPYYCYDRPAILAAGPLAISNSSVRNSGHFGIQVEHSSVSVNNCSFYSNNISYSSINLISDTISPVIHNCVFNGTDKARTVSASPGSISNLYENSDAIIELSGNVTKNSSWQKPGVNSYYRANNVTVNTGQTLTIQAGSKIEIPISTVFSVNGTLIANGSATDSIRFFGKRSTNYAFGGEITFTSVSSNSIMSYVSLDSLGQVYCPYYCYDRPAILAVGPLSITNSSIRNSGHFGIQIERSSVSVNNCSFYSNNISYSSINLISDTISPVIHNCVFNGTDKARTVSASPGSISNLYENSNAIIELSGNVTKNSSWQRPGVNSYYRANNVTVNTGQTLTIQAGSKIEIPENVFTINGTLIANGSPIDSIRFFGKRSANNSYGGGLNFSSGSLNSIMSYVNFDSLGQVYCPYYCYDRPAILAAGPLAISNSSIRNSGHYALQIERSNVSVNNCSFYSTNASYYSINLISDTISPTIQNCNFNGNDNARSIYASVKCFSLINSNTNGILRPYGNVSSNIIWPKQNTSSYYQIDGTISINSGNVLTIEAGNIINLPNSSSVLSVNGTLRAQGTETAPLQFIKIPGTGSGTYGGYISLNSASSNHVLNYCTFDKLGSNGLYVSTSNASISNISVSNSQSYGILISGSPTITSANITGNPYGVYVNSGKPILTNCNIFSNTTYGVYNGSFAVADTVDARNCYWGHPSGPNHTTLNPSGQGNKVTNKVKFNPWKEQPTNGQIVDIGVSAIIKPVTGCNLSSADSVRVKINNYGNLTQASFPVSYRINNETPVTETVTTALLPGSSIEYTFIQKANLSIPGTYQIKAYTSLSLDSVPANDTSNVTIQHLAGVNAPTNLLPAHNTMNIDIPITLNWSAVADVESYDLYIWKSTLIVPSTPTVSGLSQISYTVSANLEYGTTYSWKVVAKRSNCRAESVVQNFTTRQLPDLIIDSIYLPSTATSETNIPITWKSKNNGPGTTGTVRWNDYVYISESNLLDANAVLIGSFSNISALDSGQSYLDTISYRIPQGYQGQYYIIVKTDGGNTIREITDTNNVKVKAITIQLAPPPDLQVTALAVSPSTAFSEDSISVIYRVENLGTGPTTTALWFDRVYLSKDSILNGNTATFLISLQHNGSLPVNGQYANSLKLKLPAQIEGAYFVHVITDAGNNVFEYVREDNNTATRPLQIILRPAANLIISSVTVPYDTVSNSQSLNIQWITQNEGAEKAKPFWYDNIKLTADSLYTANPSYDVGIYQHNDTLQSLSATGSQKSVQLPYNLAEGKWYFFVKADNNNNIFEAQYENDNVSKYAGPVYVVNPDLYPVSLQAPSSAASAQNITVSYISQNIGRGSVYNSSWYDGLYLSRDTIVGSGDVLLSALQYNMFLQPNGQYNKQLSVKLPDTLRGSFYIILATDAGNAVFEKNENNNKIYTPINISLSPWPDLQITSITTPATDTAGTTINFTYTGKNAGTGKIENKNWNDVFYLSPTNNPADANKVYLTTVSNNRSLDTAQTYTSAVSALIPSTISGQYYLFASTDINNNIFENTDEGNNTKFSNAISIIPLPNVDIAVIAGKVNANSLTAGQSVTVEWMGKNAGTTPSIITSWQDAVYLSNNPVLDASDRLLGSWTITVSLSPNDTYSQTRTITIPNDASGTLYLLVNADRNNNHNDINRGNNTLVLNTANGNGGGVVITLPPPSDLVPLNLQSPAEITASQPVTISYSVKNNGTGNTNSAYWTDQVYLSTDYHLDGNDILIGSFSHNGALVPNAQYSNTQQVLIPANISGNYILIFKTDGGDNVYEYNGENNNLAFLTLLIKAQLPCDLLVTQVTAPPGVNIAGQTVTIPWVLKNAGTNPASGYMREAVYLSADTIWDAGDVLFGIKDSTINLAPQASINRQITQRLSNVAAGNYHIIIRTDILNNIVEVNETNNIKVADSAMQIDVKVLTMGITAADTLINNQPLYYRITIPASLKGETMQLTLNGDSTHHAVNRLYLGYNRAPAANIYDFASIIPFSAGQQIIVPELNEGTYYIMTLGNDTATANQPVTLLAQIIPFQVTFVDATKGGNTGAVTLKINGAKFTNTTSFKLRGSNGTISPSRVYYTNSTQVFATFNLLNSNLGLYNVVAVQANNDSARLMNGFEIVKGPGSTVGGGNGGPGSGTGFVCQITNIGFEDQFQTDVLAPASVRRSQVASLTVHYKNTGSVDIPVPTRYLLSLTNNVSIGFTIADLSKNDNTLILECRETGGPPDVLRPGAEGFFKIFINVPALLGIFNIDFLIAE